MEILGFWFLGFQIEALEILNLRIVIIFLLGISVFNFLSTIHVKTDFFIYLWVLNLW